MRYVIYDIWDSVKNKRFFVEIKSDLFFMNLITVTFSNNYWNTCCQSSLNWINIYTSALNLHLWPVCTSFPSKHTNLFGCCSPSLTSWLPVFLGYTTALRCRSVFGLERAEMLNVRSGNNSLAEVTFKPGRCVTINQSSGFRLFQYKFQPNPAGKKAISEAKNTYKEPQKCKNLTF